MSLGIYIINLKRTWEKLLLAAQAIVAIENPADVSVISSGTLARFVAQYAWLLLQKPTRSVLRCIEKQ